MTARWEYRTDRYSSVQWFVELVDLLQFLLSPVDCWVRRESCLVLDQDSLLGHVPRRSSGPFMGVPAAATAMTPGSATTVHR